jgi:hypothetical protein
MPTASSRVGSSDNPSRSRAFRMVKQSRAKVGGACGSLLACLRAPLPPGNRRGPRQCDHRRLAEACLGGPGDGNSPPKQRMCALRASPIMSSWPGARVLAGSVSRPLRPLWHADGNCIPRADGRAGQTAAVGRISHIELTGEPRSGRARQFELVRTEKFLCRGGRAQGKGAEDFQGRLEFLRGLGSQGVSSPPPGAESGWSPCDFFWVLACPNPIGAAGRRPRLRAPARATGCSPSVPRPDPCQPGGCNRIWDMPKPRKWPSDRPPHAPQKSLPGI